MSNDPNILQGLRRWALRMKPFPDQFVRVAYHRVFSPEQARKLLDGLVPRSMEDHWFVLLRPGSLDFYRSWSGFHVYRLLVRDTPEGHLVAGPLLVNANAEQVHPHADNAAVERVERLIVMTLASDPHAERY